MERLSALLKLKGRKCLVVGAGEIGESKIASLLDAGASVQAVAPCATPKIQGWARKGLRCERGNFMTWIWPTASWL